MSPRIVFECELEILKDNVEKMSLQVEKTYDELFTAVEQKDEEKIMKLMECDRVVADMERHIESQCLALITRQQPVARDLRMITTGLKVVTDIERAGDHVADMAELLLRIGMTPLKSYSEHLDPMIIATKELLHDAVEAFVGRNEIAAEDVISGDDIIDDLFNKVKRDLIEYLKKETKNADECIDILMIAKYLEKIGDHAVNIAEWELFRETGELGDVRLL